MNGTRTFELEAQLDLEMDFNFIPAGPVRLTPDPCYGKGAIYEIGEIRVYHGKQWHKVPDWLWEILNLNYEKDLVEVVNEWLRQA